MQIVKFYRALPDGRVHVIGLRCWQPMRVHHQGRAMRSKRPTVTEATREMALKGYFRTKLKPGAIVVKPAAVAVRRAIRQIGSEAA